MSLMASDLIRIPAQGVSGIRGAGDPVSAEPSPPYRLRHAPNRAGLRVLRPFRTADADEVQRLAGDRAVADTTLNIPHPYEDGMAEKWISNHRDWFERGEQAVFAVTLKPCGAGVSPAVQPGRRTTM